MRDENRHNPLPKLHIGEAMSRQTPLRLNEEAVQLPHFGTLPDGSQVTVHAMSESELQEMYRLVSEAASEGDGYGVDEWLTEADFRAEVEGGAHFAVHRGATDHMIGAFSLAVSKYFRGSSVRVADPFVIVPRAERRRGIGEFIFQRVVSFSRTLGYTGIYTDTFCNNAAMIKILERCPGMQRVGHLPLAGKMPDGTFVGGYVYFKDLRSPPTPISR